VLVIYDKKEPMSLKLTRLTVEELRNHDEHNTVRLLKNIKKDIPEESCHHGNLAAKMTSV
jgi:hypothetical protein